MPATARSARLLRIAAIISLLAASWCRGAPVHAEDEADYTVPGRLALPFPCADSYRITWTPEEHWALGKATGLAYDFGLPEGTPVVAPAAGTAHFLRDDRPLETNFGYYVDLVVEGGWLVRLAHLRDEQTGQREVRAGELLGYSGRSGNVDAHLHAELLVRDGHRWVCPDVERLHVLYGLPVETLVMDAAVVNDRCVASLYLDGDVRLEGGAPALAFGEAGRLLLPVTNTGYEAAAVDHISLSVRAPNDALRTLVANDLWQIAGHASDDLSVEILPDEAGEWRIDGATLSAAGESWFVPAAGTFTVEPPSVTLIGLSLPSVLEVGAQVRAEVWLQNTSTWDVELDGVSVVGLAASGEQWQAVAHHRVTVPAGGYRRVAVESVSVPRSVGDWRAQRVDCELGSRRLVMARVAQSFQVDGAELVIRAVEPRPDPAEPGMLLVIGNVGTATASPERLLLWGEGSDGPRYASFSVEEVGNLMPGQSRSIVVPATTYGGTEYWHLDAAGAWCGGQYLPLRLPPRLGYDEPALPAYDEETASGAAY